MGHNYLIAAFCVTWVVQLGYVIWMVVKWRGQRTRIQSGS